MGGDAIRPPVQAVGVVQPQGLTVYMYGTHVLLDEHGETRFALQSADPALLDRAVGRRVRISGRLVPGYPLSTGPLLVDVHEVTGA